MSNITMIGMLAATLTTIAFIPQVIKSWRTKHTRDVSLGMFGTLCAGLVLWLVYGILLRDLPIIMANTVTLILAGSVLVLKIRHH